MALHKCTAFWLRSLGPFERFVWSQVNLVLFSLFQSTRINSFCSEDRTEAFLLLTWQVKFFHNSFMITYHNSQIRDECQLSQQRFGPQGSSRRFQWCPTKWEFSAGFSHLWIRFILITDCTAVICIGYLWWSCNVRLSHSYSLVLKESNVTLVPHITLIRNNTLTKWSPITLIRINLQFWRESRRWFVLLEMALLCRPVQPWLYLGTINRRSVESLPSFRTCLSFGTKKYFK